MLKKKTKIKKTIACYWHPVDKTRWELRAKANHAELASVMGATAHKDRKNWLWWAKPNEEAFGHYALRVAVRKAEKALRANFRGWRFRVMNREILD